MLDFSVCQSLRRGGSGSGSFLAVLAVGSRVVCGAVVGLSCAWPCSLAAPAPLVSLIFVF